MSKEVWLLPLFTLSGFLILLLWSNDRDPGTEGKLTPSKASNRVRREYPIEDTVKDLPENIYAPDLEICGGYTELECLYECTKILHHIDAQCLRQSCFCYSVYVQEPECHPPYLVHRETAISKYGDYIECSSSYEDEEYPQKGGKSVLRPGSDARHHAISHGSSHELEFYKSHLGPTRISSLDKLHHKGKKKVQHAAHQIEYRRKHHLSPSGGASLHHYSAEKAKLPLKGHGDMHDPGPGPEPRILSEEHGTINIKSYKTPNDPKNYGTTATQEVKSHVQEHESTTYTPSTAYTVITNNQVETSGSPTNYSSTDSTVVTPDTTRKPSKLTLPEQEPQPRLTGSYEATPVSEASDMAATMPSPTSVTAAAEGRKSYGDGPAGSTEKYVLRGPEVSSTTMTTSSNGNFYDQDRANSTQATASESPSDRPYEGVPTSSSSNASSPLNYSSNTNSSTGTGRLTSSANSAPVRTNVYKPDNVPSNATAVPLSSVATTTASSYPPSYDTVLKPNATLNYTAPRSQSASVSYSPSQSSDAAGGLRSSESGGVKPTQVPKVLTVSTLMTMTYASKSMSARNNSDVMGLAVTSPPEKATSLQQDIQRSYRQLTNESVTRKTATGTTYGAQGSPTERQLNSSYKSSPARNAQGNEGKVAFK